jgi:hypothetical protein
MKYDLKNPDERRTYYREYMRKRRAKLGIGDVKAWQGKRRADLRALILELKRGGCIRCGFKGYPAALDFHHPNGDKEFSIGKAVNECRLPALVVAEIAKCELLCANCHRIEHYHKTST